MDGTSDLRVTSREDSNAGKDEGRVLVITITVSDGFSSAELVIAVAPRLEVDTCDEIIDMLVEIADILECAGATAFVSAPDEDA